MSGEPLTALIVQVPAAEAVVSAFRSRLDSNAALGVPAHITVLAPFKPASRLNTRDLAELRSLFAACRAFDFRLDHCDWFNTAVLWLGPEDPLPFRQLTERVFMAFPEYPPFEGQFADVVPHLTVGHDCDLDELRSAEQAIQPRLPIDGRADRVTLMVESASGSRWETAGYFPLGH